ncbi:phosphate ABC transporter substrate-binding protein [Halomicronema hongdechloris C2206]|uniref:Phosphate ABC transporter substrate-binding protein n=1 Tax=Halomicronema hongdechloris C2206 TaxID=1641165 RepID=A0A1Z3HTV6_9CYAN|nr:phosphate/phosphite/phosphonate ABC transporter substrate-binding protein [Halomicronema hongdechloris]ASC73734.1 phosphate ABC transporter substrate-binding protein [Halomicronema hongdechloris C2206]
MLHLWLKIILGLGVILGVSGCSPDSLSSDTTSPAADPAATETFVIADISDEPAAKIDAYQPMANYLAEQLSEFGIEAGAVKVAPDMATMTQWLATGDVDLYFDSPYPAMRVKTGSGATVLLRRWKTGVAAYSTILFARQDSNRQTVHDLLGQVVAFEEEFSTSGYMLPKAYLAEAGLSLTQLNDPTAQVPPDQIGYVFSRHEQTTIQWVLSQRVVAGAVGSPYFYSIPESTREQLVILAETEALPRHIGLVSPTMDAAQQQALKTVLMAMDETPAGRDVLQQFEETAQFDEFPQGASTAIARIKVLYDLVGD